MQATDSTPDRLVARKPRRRRTKATKRQDDKPRKVSVYLSDEATKRPRITAAMEDTTQSAIIERLILESLRTWVVSNRGGRSNDREDPAGNEEGSDIEAA